LPTDLEIIDKIMLKIFSRRFIYFISLMVDAILYFQSTQSL